eukprot:m.117730 g.117730  ORF g.117730 m.117730 type:complete len:54 (+) comp37624_c0_seq15:747-908(+)
MRLLVFSPPVLFICGASTSRSFSLKQDQTGVYDQESYLNLSTNSSHGNISTAQ